MLAEINVLNCCLKCLNILIKKFLKIIFENDYVGIPTFKLRSYLSSLFSFIQMYKIIISPQIIVVFILKVLMQIII